MNFDQQAISQMVADRKEGGLGRAFHDVVIVAWRNILIDLRNPAEVLASTAFSISLLCVFTASFARVVNPGGSFSEYAQFLLPFTIVQGLLFNTVNVGIAFYNDLEGGMDMRLRAMPIARLSAVGGRLISAGVRLLFQVLGSVLVAHLLGFRFSGGLLGAIGFFLLPVIFTLSIAMISLYVATEAKSAEAISAAMNPWILPLTFLSVGYVPKEAFPDWIVGFVVRNPVSIASDAMRKLATHESAIGSGMATLAWSLVLFGVFGWLTLRAYRKRL
ncbi:ABC transporter permease [Leptothoe sp. LEGE 181152]|nr:ABC transporter permease [Leptothoe sp. LEGE 181152]